MCTEANTDLLIRLSKSLSANSVVECQISRSMPSKLLKPSEDGENIKQVVEMPS